MIVPLWHEIDGESVRVGTAIVERPREGGDFEVVLYLDDPLAINDPENARLIPDLKSMAHREERKNRNKKSPE